MRTENWHFSNLVSSWEREGRIFNLKTIHQLQLTRKKNTTALSQNTYLFEMPADMTGESIRMICVGLIQSTREAVANTPGRTSNLAHYFHFCFPFSPQFFTFCTTASAAAVRLKPVPQVCMPSLPHVQEGVKGHVHSGQTFFYLFIFTEKEGRKADKVWSENLILKFWG